MEKNNAREIKRAKRFNYAVAILSAAVIIAAVLYLGIDEYQHSFTTGRWIDNPEKRVNIIDNMLGKHELKGKSRDEIKALLGEETKDAYFKANDNIVYYLGPERGLVSIDSE